MTIPFPFSLNAALALDLLQHNDLFSLCTRLLEWGFELPPELEEWHIAEEKAICETRLDAKYEAANRAEETVTDEDEGAALLDEEEDDE